MTREALKNWITWCWFDKSKDLDDSSIEHIWRLMQEGYTSGELYKDDDKGNDVRGWWKKK